MPHGNLAAPPAFWPEAKFLGPVIKHRFQRVERQGDVGGVFAGRIPSVTEDIWMDERRASS
jgi:hypothetical protein